MGSTQGEMTVARTDEPTNILVTIKIPAWKSEAAELIEDLQFELGLLVLNLGGVERDATIDISTAE